MAVATAPRVEDQPTVAAEPTQSPDVPEVHAVAAEAADAVTTDADDRSYLVAVAKGFVIGTVIWAALIFAIMYAVADLPLGDSVKWALWIGPWGGLFLGGTFTVGFWSQKHHS